MSNSYNYNPVPPRVWSRVQNPCTYTNGSANIDYSPVYIPLTNQTVSLAQADYEKKLFYKGNILQYKANSSRLTKSQKYSQLAKGFGIRVFATQGQTYTNPNTTGLLRVNYQTYPFPNQLIGKPNNISGPFQYNVQNPFGCSSNSLQDGGNLVCGTYANPCTGVVTQTLTQSQCNPTYCSDVPGPIINLCWNPKLQTFFPKQRYVMNNSANKWPQGYKGFQSAIKPVAPLLTEVMPDTNSATLNWLYNNNVCIPVSSFNIYQNTNLVKTVSYQLASTVIYGLTNNTSYSFYITAISNKIESDASNIIVTTTL
jgi:hypothetical protein